MISKPILLNFDMPLRTQRLTIRPVMPGDSAHMYPAFLETKSELMKWMDWAPTVSSVDVYEETCRTFYADFIKRKAFHLGIYEGERFVGTCSLHAISWSIGSADIGYWCPVSCQGKGYMREAVGALVKFAFQDLELKRLTITAYSSNTRSCALAEALGFTLETQARGLMINIQKGDLVLCNRYVRFDAQGL
jgi:RimJ/RimL family protein N-acetyltransferase